MAEMQDTNSKIIYLMLSILISFPVFSFTGLSRPAYKLFLNLYPAFLPFQWQSFLL
jgi:hypothetical protein